MAAAGISLLLAGRVLGLGECYVIGAAALVTVWLAWVWTALLPLDAEGTRLLWDSSASVGATVQAQAVIEWRARRSSPPLELYDACSFDGKPPLRGGRSNRRRSCLRTSILVSPMRPSERRQCGYSMDMRRRGRAAVGPLVVQAGDPLGLATKSVALAGRVTVEVGPMTEPVAPPPEPDSHHRSPSSVWGPMVARDPAAEGTGLRPYVTGDDLRSVHWPSTARTGELMVSPEPPPVSPSVTVVADTTGLTLGGDCTSRSERVLSAAASVLQSSARAGFRSRLVLTSGEDSGFGHGMVHWNHVRELLATAGRRTGTVERRSPAWIPEGAAGDGSGRPTGSSTLVVVSGSAGSPADHEAVGRLRRQGWKVMVVMFQPEPYRSGRPGVSGRAAEGTSRRGSLADDRMGLSPPRGRRSGDGRGPAEPAARMATPTPASSQDCPDGICVPPGGSFAAAWNDALARYPYGRLRSSR
ncbi:MAG: DUF58 domain-containing protein [Actinomycetota bacterium]|nr:DUF58 domain-containing protein [Actinomycetota bacterium]